jgi:pimeloyl-ACP methyl ester carboxylesterase
MPTIPVPGATLFYESSGSGPLLLILQGGAGDADGCAALVAALAPDLTVVTYDRRGLSRSTLADPSAPVTIATHADDAIALLESVGAATSPALLFGVSIGALIGLDVVARRPDLVRMHVAHEPPLAAVLPAAERDAFAHHQKELEATFRTHGPLVAMQKFMTILGIDPTDREPDAPLPERTVHLGENVERLITVDAPAVRLYSPDLAALRGVRDRIVPAVGANSRATMHGGPVLALARALDRDVVTFPGGHGGYAAHPIGTAATLCRLFIPEPRSLRDV